jgi:aspartate/tyrosine/aromatic aminotransferase
LHYFILFFKAFGIQSLSGTGALKIGFDFLARNGYKTLYVSDPTWGNHNLMAKTSGFNVKKYRYYNPQTKSIDFDGLCQDIEVIYLVFIFMIEYLSFL